MPRILRGHEEIAHTVSSFTFNLKLVNSNHQENKKVKGGYLPTDKI